MKGKSYGVMLKAYADDLLEKERYEDLKRRAKEPHSAESLATRDLLHRNNLEEEEI